MSDVFNVETLKAATNENVPSFLRAPENGTTSNVAHDTVLEFGLLGKGARIVNNDSLNSLTLRLHSATATAIIIPASSEISIEEWFNEIHVEPNAVTGDFQLTIELANKKDATKEPTMREIDRVRI